MIRLTLFKEAMEKYVINGCSGTFPLISPFSLQRPEVYYPGLETRPLHDKNTFEWVQRLELGWPNIVEELNSLLNQRAGFSKLYKDYTNVGDWAGCYFWIFGQEIQKNCELCPDTTKILKSIPGATEFGTALFSALAPGTRVASHCGYSNSKLRCQLPLQVPNNCGFKIADQTISMVEGSCFIFDDSFLHTAWNESDRSRFVLIFDFFHPNLTAEETKYLNSLTLDTQIREYYLNFIKQDNVANWVYE